MKIENKSELNVTPKADKQSTRTESDLMSGGDLSAEGLGERSDFASVLDRVTRSHDESRPREHAGDSNRLSESKNRKDDDDKTRAAAVGQSVDVPRTAHVEAPVNVDTSSILHTVDLEKIVTACQVQLIRGNQPEVIVDLSRSVLDGLRVKVRSDTAGRITAEFLASNEGVKSLLDSRSSELIALLRSRGIDLAEFKSSVAADTNTQGNARGNAHGNDRQERNATSAVAAASSDKTQSADDREAGNIADAASGSTYRA
jgi:flagellar hook-length control protein FliK